MRNDNDNTRSFIPIARGIMISRYKIIEKIGARMGSRVNNMTATSGISKVSKSVGWNRCNSLRAGVIDLTTTC